MAKIIGNTIATPMAVPDWTQTDSRKADYIKNKPELGNLAAKNTVEKSDLATSVQTSLDNANIALVNVDELSAGVAYIDETDNEDIESDIESAKDELKEYLSIELAKRGQLKPEFANSIEECTDTTKLYVLPDGMIWAYMRAEQTTDNDNKILSSVNSDGTPFNGGVGYKTGYRLNSSGAETALDGGVVTGFIRYTEGKDIELRLPRSGLTTNEYLHCYNSSFGWLKTSADGATINGSDRQLSIWVSQYGATQVDEGDTVKIIIPASSLNIDNIYYVRVSCKALATVDGTTFNLAIGESVDGSTVSVDSWTNTGIAFIPANYESMVVVQRTPNFANSIDECVDTDKLYVLPDGYIYAYTKTQVWQEGSKNLVSTSVISGGGKVYNDPLGYEFGVRLNSSGATTTLSNCFVTGFIPVKNGDTVRIKYFAKGALANFSYSGCYIALYNSSYAKLSSTAGTSLKTMGTQDDNAKVFTVNVSNILNDNNIAFLRVSTNILDTATEEDGKKLIVTVNEEIKDGGYVEKLGWASTGHAFVPANYENRIIILEEATANHDSRLTLLEENNNGNVPSYWMNELNTKVDTIQQAMETAGRNKSAFLWYTDAHWQTNSKMSPKLLKYIADNTSMNKVNFGGDIISDPNPHNHTNTKYVYEWRKMISDLPNHHSVYGNHDVNHRTTDVSKMAYAQIIAHEETPDMVVGGDSYYYIDNPSEKTRYLYLSFLSDSSEKTAQGTFIVNTISTVSDGWHIVVIGHRWWQYNSSSNPTDGYVMQYETEMLNLFDKYNARGTYTASTFFGGQNFANAKGKVEFCIGGHIHVDYDFTSNGGIPVIITAPDTNQERAPEETEDSGTKGTITESAVFGIIADYNNNKITVVGVGRGTSREIDY